MQAVVETAAPDITLPAEAIPANPPFDVIAAPAGEVNPLALVTLSPEKFVAEVYKPFKDRLSSAIDSVRTVDYDIKTTAGMTAAVKCRALFRDLRVEADKERESRKKPITKIGKLLESGFDGIEERIAPIEQMFDFDIQRETKRKADEKAERERIAAARIANIRGAIDAIRVQSAQAAGKTAAELRTLLEQLANRIINETEFAELTNEAQQALDAVGEELLAMYNAAREREEAATEAARELAEEQARLAAERDELARLRAEQAERERLAKAEADRIAAEQAAEGKRLADLIAAQEAELRRQREAEAARVRAEDEARAAAYAEQQAAFEVQRAAFAREQEEAAQREADRVRLQSLVEEARADVDALPASLDELMATTFPLDDLPLAEPLAMPESAPVQAMIITDHDIIRLFADAYGIDDMVAIDRLEAIDFAAARARYEVAA